MVENHTRFATTVVRQFLFAHDVEVVPSLAAALRAGPAEVTLVDYDLDDGKGDELIRRLRRDGHRGRIIAISAHAEGNAALVAAGADAVCAKSDFPRITGLLRER